MILESIVLHPLTGITEQDQQLNILLVAILILSPLQPLLNTMQVSVSCPDLGFPVVSFTAVADSLVSDVLTAAAEEWGIDPKEVELSFAGEILCETGRLAVHGVGPNTELEVWKKRFRLFDKSWLIDETKREELIRRLTDNGEQCVYLDTPTFLENDILVLEEELIPPVVKQITFRNSNFAVKSIELAFLATSSLTSLDLSALNNITEIGEYFLGDCSFLTSLDLSGMNSVTKIADLFLGGCCYLTSLNLSGMNSVTEIGGWFLENCSSITSLDLSCLNSVTEIGEYFLGHCASITSLDLSCLSSVTEIECSFLANCSSITALDLSCLNSVTEIGEMFLANCFSITSLDLSGLNCVTAIRNGPSFLEGCEGLQSIKIPENNELLAEVSSRFSTVIT